VSDFYFCEMSITIGNKSYVIPPQFSPEADKILSRKLRDKLRYSKKANTPQIRKCWMKPVFVDSFGNIVDRRTPGCRLYLQNKEFNEQIRDDILESEAKHLVEVPTPSWGVGPHFNCSVIPTITQHNEAE
jgi:hypothetical protein